MREKRQKEPLGPLFHQVLKKEKGNKIQKKRHFDTDIYILMTHAVLPRVLVNVTLVAQRGGGEFHDCKTTSEILQIRRQFNLKIQMIHIKLYKSIICRLTHLVA